VNIFVEHDAATLARLVGAAPLACDRIIVRHGDPSDVLACARLDNPLHGAWLVDLDLPGSMVLAWSGSMSESLTERDPRNWGRIGRTALECFCDDLAPQLQRHDRRLCFHPHSRHVLSDAPSCRSFVLQRCGGDQPFAIALAPASMLEPPMLERVDEHLERQFEALGATCGMVLLTDVQVRSDADGEPHCSPAPCGQGMLPRDVMRALARAWIPEATPIVLHGRNIEEQLDWLAI
jgi:hypothetical protein